MKERISAKIVRHYGKRILKLFYKLSVSSNPIKSSEIELVDDEDVETMVALYSQNKSGHIELTQLFAELADVELTEDFTALSEEYGVQHPYGEDGYDNNALFDHKVKDFSDLDLDEVPDDIDDECVNRDRNVYASSVGNSSRGIVICNDPKAHILIIDPNMAHASKFPGTPIYYLLTN
ncbi:hypothetical protein GOBAR_DD17393 [Gossypium barbadense]|nr:hypothetical protein GOBAR_DD17393 [Gossypium barbadense]